MSRACATQTFPAQLPLVRYSQLQLTECDESLPDA